MDKWRARPERWSRRPPCRHVRMGNECPQSYCVPPRWWRHCPGGPSGSRYGIHEQPWLDLEVLRREQELVVEHAEERLGSDVQWRAVVQCTHMWLRGDDCRNGVERNGMDWQYGLAVWTGGLDVAKRRRRAALLYTVLRNNHIPGQVMAQPVLMVQPLMVQKLRRTWCERCNGLGLTSSGI